MRRLLWFVIVLVSLLPRQAFSWFSISGGADWYETEMKTLSCEIEVQGLLVETTISFQVGLIPHCPYNNNCTGDATLSWRFGLTEEAVVTGCWMKEYGAADFMEADITDLTGAEERYAQYPGSKAKLLLRQRMVRQWNGSLDHSYQMDVAPIQPAREPIFMIRFIAPVIPCYESRRIWLPLGDFSANYPCDVELLYYDRDNPDQRFNLLEGMSGYTLSSWTKSAKFHRAVFRPNNIYYSSYSDILISAAPESGDRRYLRTFEEDGDRFYQLSIAPPIEPEDRQPKNILLAVDVSDRIGYSSAAFQKFKEAVGVSTSARDSITLVFSEFTPTIYDSLFRPVSAARLSTLFGALKSAPTLNTLPHLLRAAVDLFNRRDKGGEIWFITDAFNQSNPPQAAMEIISQTVCSLNHPVVFRILSLYNSWNSQSINGQFYYGNDYLYENLARLSRGSFISLVNTPGYSYLDAMLDCFAPTAAAVDIIAEPQGGLSYSRFDLNRGRSDFPIHIPYYEIGLYEGGVPFDLRYYGNVDGGLFSKDVSLARVTGDYGWRITADYWFATYIRNLLLEPQTHETISYIEDVSVSHSLLTPYSGYVIPAADGVIAFKRLEEESELQTVEESTAETASDEFAFSAFPNPFNASITLDLVIPAASATETVIISIVNMLGQTVRTWSMSQAVIKGNVTVRWDSRDDNGFALPSGLYVVAVRAGQWTHNTKITLLK